jgi:hypothetical protein
VVEISTSQLKKAEEHFRSIVKAPGGLRERDVDWRVIKTALGRLRTALAQDNASEFNEAFAMLKARLNPPNVVRGQIGSEPESKSAVMPPEVLELLNHIVDTLHLELNQPPSAPQKDEAKK